MGFSNVVLEPEGRISKVMVAGLNLVNIYTPSGRKKESERRLFFHETLPAYTSWNKEPILIMGDFNSIEEERDRCTDAKTSKSKVECRSLKDFIHARGLTDVWREIRGAENGYTFFYKGGASRIDRCYSNQELINRIANIYTLTAAITDHLCLAIEVTGRITQHEPRRRKNQWKMNTSILEEECFQVNFMEFWTRITAQSDRRSDITRWWENSFKIGFKKLTIRYCRYRAAKRREEREELNSRLTEITNKLSRGEGGLDEFMDLKKEIKEWEKEKANGGKIRSAKSMDKEEAITTFHLNEHRKRIGESKITELEVDGRVVVEKEVAVEIIKFFKSVFQRKDTVECKGGDEFLDQVEGRVDPKECNLEGEIILEELRYVLEKAKKDKSPGFDGIPYEFYHFFF